MEAYHPCWLEEIDFDKALTYYGFDEPCRTRLHKELELLKQDETLNRACRLMHYVLFYDSRDDAEDTTLRRSMKERLLRGEMLHQGFGCFRA